MTRISNRRSGKKPFLQRALYEQAASDIGQYPLILVSAPAGYGKTALADEMRRRIPDEWRTVWLDCSRDESSEGVFLSRLRSLVCDSGASEAIGPTSGLSMQSDIHEAELDRLLSALDSIERPLTIFIEGYDHVESRVSNVLIERLATQNPQRICTVLTVRQMPEVPVARMRAYDQARVIDADELKLTDVEAREFLANFDGLSLSERGLTTLVEQADGWIAGLQIAAQLCVGLPDNASISGETIGGHSMIADFLAHEILEDQPEDLQNLLMLAAVPRIVSPGLLSELTGNANSAQRLRELHRQGLFLFPAERENWYRFHPIVRRFLIGRARHSSSIELTENYRIASRWFENADMPDLAVGHAMDTGDPEFAAASLERFAEHMLRVGEVRPIMDWFARLGPAVAKGRLRLAMIQVWADVHLGRSAEGDEALEALNELAASDEELEKIGYTRKHFEAEFRTLQVCLASQREDREEMSGLLDEKIDLASPVPFLEGTKANGLAAIATGFSQLELADRYAGDAEHLLGDAHSAYGVVFSICVQGLNALNRALPSSAERLFHRAKQIASSATGTQSYSFALANMLWGIARYQQGDFTQAERALQDSLPRALGCGYVEFWRRGVVCLSRLYSHRSDWESAEQWLRDGSHLQRPQSARTYLLIDDALVDIHLRSGQVELARYRAIQAARDLDPLDDDTAYSRTSCLPYRMLARVDLAEGRFEEAIEKATKLAEVAEASGFAYRQAEFSLLAARARLAAGLEEQAATDFRNALEILARQSLIAPVLDEGFTIDQVDKLVRLGGGPGAFKEYLAELNACINEDFTSREDNDFDLTSRELDVLRLLDEGCPNKEIADRLSVSENTVKWHVRNILDKLAVDNRSRAVTVAREALLFG